MKGSQDLLKATSVCASEVKKPQKGIILSDSI